MERDSELIQNNEFAQKVAAAKDKIDKEIMTEQDILLLAADSIVHSYTFAEKGYGFGEPKKR